MTKSTVTRFVVGGLIALIVGVLRVGLVATFVSLTGRPGGPVEDAPEADLTDGAA